MDFDEQSLNSAPTMGPGGFRPPVADEPSIGSAPTMVPGRDASVVRPLILGQIDQYALVRKLGGGGFGVVYLARDTVSGVNVAIKTLHPLLKSNPEEMETLRAKFALVSRLSHPNIARALVLHPCRDISITDDEVHRELHLAPGDFVMVMDYAPGVTLSKWRRQFPDGVVPLDLALEVVRQIASALDYAHGEKIVHRDIKPANVMVETLPPEASQPSQVESRKSESRKFSSAGSQSDPSLVTRHPSLVTSKIRVRILDFGLAAEIRSSMSRMSSEMGDTSGTRPYMAPEQWLGKRQDGFTDQYALACLLYDMLTGGPPFAGVFETGDPTIMLAAVRNEKPDEIDDIPVQVNAALMRALAKNPKERFDSCTAFVENCLAQSSQSEHSDFPHGEPQDSTAAPLSPVLVKCPICKRWRSKTDTFDCSECGRENLCIDHQDRTTYLCVDCAARKAREEFERQEVDRRAKEEAARKAEENRKAREWIGSQAGERKIVSIGSVRVALRWCPPGTFTMGSPITEKGRDDDEGQHRVALSKGFWMGETPVTQGLWKEVKWDNPSSSRSGDNYPVENVSWNDCQEFLRELNARVPQSGLKWALPTEAQWEYACRATTTGPYGVTGGLDNTGWFSFNSGSVTHPVAEKRPNAWGLYDMHGNVWEWCQDTYATYPVGHVTNPSGSASGNIRVLRGGSCWDDPQDCRSANRSGSTPSYRDGHDGFRLVAFLDGK